MALSETSAPRPMPALVTDSDSEPGRPPQSETPPEEEPSDEEEPAMFPKGYLLEKLQDLLKGKNFVKVARPCRGFCDPWAPPPQMFTHNRQLLDRIGMGDDDNLSTVVEPETIETQPKHKNKKKKTKNRRCLAAV